jgi:drug/metabolite transporter (DMT)-like permease
VVSVLFALLTALCNGTASVLQRIAAAAAPDSHALHLSLFSYLIRRKVWLAGIGMVIIAAVSQATALATGPVALVQPIFIIELPFTLLVAGRLAHRRLPRRAWWAVGLVTVSLGGGLAAAAPSGGTTQAPLKVWVPTLIVTGCFEAIVIAVGVRTRGNARGAALGLAAACGYALTATLMKSAVSALSQGVLPFFTSWQLYATAAAGVGALFLLQNALQAGSLVAVQPPLTLGDALISASYGVTVFNENVRTGGWLLVIEIAAVLAVAAGCIELSRSLALMHTAGSVLDVAAAPAPDAAAELSREPAADRRLGPSRPRGRLASARVVRAWPIRPARPQPLPGLRYPRRATRPGHRGRHGDPARCACGSRSPRPGPRGGVLAGRVRGPARVRRRRCPQAARPPDRPRLHRYRPAPGRQR